VATLEAIASAQVRDSREREYSWPTGEIKITASRVRSGEPSREKIERPQPDLGDEPTRVRVQKLCVAYAAGGRRAEDAEVLAEEYLQRALAGEDFTAMVVEHSDEATPDGEPVPGLVRVLNHGAFDVESLRAQFDVQIANRARVEELVDRYRRDEIGIEEFTKAKESLQREVMRQINALRWVQRNLTPPLFTKLAFELEPGEFGKTLVTGGGMLAGWYVVHRIE
jgi:hypothetical protein